MSTRKHLSIIGICLTICAVRLAYVAKCGGPVPIDDDWRIPQLVLLPWLKGQLTVDQLFQHHNEHRMFFVRIMSLLSFILNGGQWDVMVGLVINVLIIAGAVGLICATAYRQISILSCAFAVLLWSTPNHLRDNLLFYFQQGWFWFMFMTVASICLLPRTTLTVKWWLSLLWPTAKVLLH